MRDMRVKDFNTFINENMNEEMKTIGEEELEIFRYLNDLRVSGITNMFGAAPYIQREFGISRQEAREHLSKWMKNFNPEGYDHLEVVPDDQHTS